MPMHRPVLKIIISIDFQKSCRTFAYFIKLINLIKFNLQFNFLYISKYSIYNTIITIFLQRFFKVVLFFLGNLMPSQQAQGSQQGSQASQGDTTQKAKEKSSA